MESTDRHNMKNNNLGGAIRAAHFLSFLRHQKEKIYLHPFSQSAETNSNILH
jgi:leucyl aminopeptidase